MALLDMKELSWQVYISRWLSIVLIPLEFFMVTLGDDEWINSQGLINTGISLMTVGALCFVASFYKAIIKLFKKILKID
jgi:hypothetical protein